MEPLTVSTHGFMPDGQLAWTVLFVWLGLVLLHGCYRSWARPAADAIRPSGPIEG